MRKYAIDRMYIEIGRWCNMTCKHCLKGEREKLAINPQYVEKFLDNIYLVNILCFCGGEASFYVNEMKEVLEIFRKKNVPVNYIRVHSNILNKNERFINFLNDVSQYATYPQVKLFVSKDRYHLENMREMGIDYKQYEVTKEWYKNRLSENVIIRENSDPQWKLLLEGKANNLSSEELKGIDLLKYDYNLYRNIPIVPQTIKNEDKNVIMENGIRGITLSTEGYLFFTIDFSYETQRKNNYYLSLGHVNNDSLENLINIWNSNCTGKHSEDEPVQEMLQENSMRKFIHQSTEIMDKVKEAVNLNDEGKLLELKAELEKSIEEYKIELNSIIDKNDFEVKNPMIVNGIMSLGMTLTTINKLLEFPNGFFRKLALGTIEYYAKKAKEKDNKEEQPNE